VGCLRFTDVPQVSLPVARDTVGVNVNIKCKGEKSEVSINM